MYYTIIDKTVCSVRDISFNTELEALEYKLLREYSDMINPDTKLTLFDFMQCDPEYLIQALQSYVGAKNALKAPAKVQVDPITEEPIHTASDMYLEYKHYVDNLEAIPD